MEFLAKLISTFFFVGLLPKAPGTWGSFAALLPVWIFYKPGLFWYSVAGLSLFLVGVWAADLYSKQVGKKDPDEVVIDEVIGVWAVFLFVEPTLVNLLVGAILFRVFDILKPPPIGWFERLGGGLGIMADDLVAGIITGLVLYSFQFLWK